MNPRTRLVSASATFPLGAPHTSAPRSEIESDMRWNQWADKGRRESAAFKEKLRVVAALAGLAIGLAAAIWGYVSW
jgi:hypothetical protein